VFQAEGLN